MKTEIETVDLTFSFDDLHVLSVVHGDVHLSIWDENEKRSILSLPREKFVQSMHDWLNRKADYWNNWGHYCGVGYVLVYDCVKGEDDIYILTGDSEIMVDIEHG